ncbi:hypothetical protein DPMN_113435 [Dreissena polymorpha]|uniref:Uncharacterized protein n=1 Tax=Dreissena polymorpha TaxID=45954 RepID=A0A9D4KIA4_DREPO|nr:hypothetical protein DPMN_113435 [Dreissena polymorpha]
MTGDAAHPSSARWSDNKCYLLSKVPQSSSLQPGFFYPMDFCVFPDVKSQLRCIRFESKQELTVAAQRIVSSFDADWIQILGVDRQTGVKHVV